MSITKTYKVELHSSFLLNNKKFNEKTLLFYAKQLVEEGEVHEVATGEFLISWLDPNPYLIVHTSGSTGAPKAIKVLKQHMIYSAKATSKFFDVLENSTALLCLSASYIAGKMMLVRAMVLGWKLDVIAPKINPLDELLKCYDFCAMVPMQLDNSVARLHLIKKLIVGGGAISEYLVQLVQDKKTKIYETYGMTETVSHIAARRVNSKKRDFEDSFFKALPNIILSVDSRNCLEIKAPSVANNKIITNDIVKLISHKKFCWKGRIDNVVNSGGIKLFPEEIERKLQVIIRSRFLASWLPDDKLGQQLILLVEDPSMELKDIDIFNKIKLLNTIKKHEKPKQIFFFETFVETDSGKVHREKNRLRVVS